MMPERPRTIFQCPHKRFCHEDGICECFPAPDPAPLVTEEEARRFAKIWCCGDENCFNGRGCSGLLHDVRRTGRILESFLSTRPAGVIPEGWRTDIENAPKDGNEFNVYRPDAGVFAAFWQHPPHEDGGLSWDDEPTLFAVSGDDLTRDPPTHWQPLPAPPDAAPTYSPQPEGGEKVCGSTVAVERSSADAPSAPVTTVGWQDIASAPRDGTTVLLGSPNWPNAQTGWTFGDDPWQGCRKDSETNGPTCWQPISASPTTSGPNVAEAPIEGLVQGADGHACPVTGNDICKFCPPGTCNLSASRRCEPLARSGSDEDRAPNSGVENPDRQTESASGVNVTSEPGQGHAGSLANSPVAWMVTRPAGQIYGRIVFVTLDHEEAEGSTGNPKPIVQPLYLAPSPSVAGLAEQLKPFAEHWTEYFEKLNAPPDVAKIAVATEWLRAAAETIRAYEAQRAGRGS